MRYLQKVLKSLYNNPKMISGKFHKKFRETERDVRRLFVSPQDK
jgi:hypothetical protein